MKKCPVSGFLSFLKKREITFYCLIPHGEKLFPIKEAQNANERKWLEKCKKWFLDFYKKAHPSQKINSAHRCPGIRSLINTGFIASLHRDVIIETNGDGESLQFWEGNQLPQHLAGEVSAFPPEVMSSHLESSIPKGAHKALIKIGLPWRVKAPLDTVFYITGVPYQDDNRFQCVPGILDPLIGGGQINCIFWWFVNKGVETIKADTPMLQLIPIKRDKIYDSWSMKEEDVKKTGILDFAMGRSQLTNYSTLRDLTVKIFK